MIDWLLLEPNLIGLTPLQMDVFELWESFYGFTAMVIMAFGLIGLSSRSMAIGAFGGYLLFVTIAVETGDTFFINITYVSLVLVFVGMAFKLIRFEGWGGGADG